MPETNSKFTPENGWNMNFLVGYGLFSGAFAISFKECIVYVLGSKLLILGINSSQQKNDGDSLFHGSLKPYLLIGSYDTYVSILYHMGVNRDPYIDLS